MLQKQNRLIKKRDFDRVHRNGKFAGERFLAIKYLKNNIRVLCTINLIVGIKFLYYYDNLRIDVVGHYM